LITLMKLPVAAADLGPPELTAALDKNVQSVLSGIQFPSSSFLP
jgi:hypothetical protein